MTELFDMGKYDFYVWGSIAVFILALLIDYMSARSQNKRCKTNIKATHKRKQSRTKQETINPEKKP